MEKKGVLLPESEARIQAPALRWASEQVRAGVGFVTVKRSPIPEGLADRGKESGRDVGSVCSLGRS